MYVWGFDKGPHPGNHHHQDTEHSYLPTRVLQPLCHEYPSPVAPAPCPHRSASPTGSASLVRSRCLLSGAGICASALVAREGGMLGSRFRGLNAVVQPLFAEHLLCARLLVRCRHLFPGHCQQGLRRAELCDWRPSVTCPRPFFFCSSQLSPCLPCPSSQQPCAETLPLLSPKIWPATKMWLLFWGAAVFRAGLGAPDASLSPSNTVLWDYLWQAHCAPGEWGLGLSPLLSLQGLEQNRHKSLSSRAGRDSPGARW